MHSFNPARPIAQARIAGRSIGSGLLITTEAMVAELKGGGAHDAVRRRHGLLIVRFCET